MINSTVTHLPSSLAAGVQGAILCLSVLDSVSMPVPLQPEEAQKLCSLESLMILRESRSSSAGPSTAKIVFSDIVLGNASMGDVVNCITNDLGTEFDSLVPLISQDDPADRIASLRQFLMIQMGLLISSPDVQVFGMAPLGQNPSSSATMGGNPGSSGDSGVPPKKLFLVAPGLIAKIQESLSLTAANAAASVGADSGKSSTSGPSPKRASAQRIPRKKKARSVTTTDSSQNGDGSVPSVKEFFPSVPSSNSTEVRKSDNAIALETTVSPAVGSSGSGDMAINVGDSGNKVRVLYIVHVI